MRPTRPRQCFHETVLIIGASRGLGLALAEEWARHGWHVTPLSANSTRSRGSVEIPKELREAALQRAMLFEQHGTRTLASLLLNSRSVLFGGKIARSDPGRCPLGTATSTANVCDMIEISASLTLPVRYPATTRSPTIRWARRSVMSRATAISRRRIRGSRAIKRSVLP